MNAVRRYSAHTTPKLQTTPHTSHPRTFEHIKCQSISNWQTITTLVHASVVARYEVLQGLRRTAPGACASCGLWGREANRATVGSHGRRAGGRKKREYVRGEGGKGCSIARKVVVVILLKAKGESSADVAQAIPLEKGKEAQIDQLPPKKASFALTPARAVPTT